ncbi:MAG: anthranilate synthase component I family protein [Leptospirillia bacterium]
MHDLIWTTDRDTYFAHDAAQPLGAYVPLRGRTPQALLEALGPVQRPFLLESPRRVTGLARWSFLGGDPAWVLRVDRGGVQVRTRAGKTTRPDLRPLSLIREQVGSRRMARPAPFFPPFFGGFVGTFSYDFARCLERLPEQAVDDLFLPDADLSFVDLVVAVDHEADRLWVTCLPEPSHTHGGRALAYDRARGRIAATLERLDPVVEGAPAAPPFGGAAGPVTGELSQSRFEAMASAAKDYIAAGDIFQANLSQRFRAAMGAADPWRLYGALTAVNPSPFACYLDLTDYQVVSSSPERLVSLCAGVVEGRPIAGTRPRGHDPEADLAFAAELLANTKERAEHVMLLDLMRNDLGRVCDYGSVRVSEFMTTERYSHVIHIVSNVIGRMAAGKDAASLIRAVFPGGTITGAPKVRCMEIIEEQEPVRRGIYTGSAGYLSVSGDMDLNILIRSILVKDGEAYFQTGAGIVADSDPTAEYQETLHKAEAMRRVLAGVGVAGERQRAQEVRA